MTAQYCSGLPELYDGARRYVWRASIFVFPIPYHPTANLAQSDPDVATALARRSSPGQTPTVLDLLAAARAVHGVGYSYAWWDAHFLLLSVGGCLLLLVVIVPNALHVARFGHLKPAPKRKSRMTASPVVPAAVVADEPDASESDITPTHPQPAPTAVPPVPALNAGPVESTAAPAARSDDPAAFGMKGDDYYPTVRPRADRPPQRGKAGGS